MTKQFIFKQAGRRSRNTEKQREYKARVALTDAALYSVTIRTTLHLFTIYQ